MSSTTIRAFNGAVWNHDALELPEELVPVLEQLKEELCHIDLPIASQLMTGETSAWTKEQMIDLEKALVCRLGERLEVPAASETVTFREPILLQFAALMDCLAKVVDLIIKSTGKSASYPRVFRRQHPEKNPFHADVVAAENQMQGIRQLVERGHAHKLTDTDDLIALALLASLSHYSLMDKDTQVAWMEALAQRKNCSIRLPREITCIQLNAAFQDQPRAERRLYISQDRRTDRILKRIRGSKVRRILAHITNDIPDPDSYAARVQSHRRRRKAITQYLEAIVEKLVAKLSFGQGTATLSAAMKAARTVAYLRLPAGVAAYQGRKTVSHSPRIAVLRRIFDGSPVLVDDTSRTDAKSDANEENDTPYQAIDAEIQDSSGLEPRWYVQMRAAFRLGNKRAVGKELVRISEASDAMGGRISEFARYLLAKHSIGTAARYSLLIGRRLGCWQEGESAFDPKDLSVSELESLYEEILEDEREEYATDGDELGMYNKRPIAEAISRFHNFLHDRHGVGELVELKGRLRSNGLLPVNANFITIDEYQHVLQSIDGDTALNDPYLRNAVKLFVSICFWCGLRREEAIGLRLIDLDSANHLHVRPYRNRQLKTGNANRSIPAADLMLSYFPSLRDWVTSRRTSPCSSAPALIFSRQRDSSKPIPKQFIYGKTLEHMRVALKDPSLKIHHLRHSFATLLAIRLLPGMEDFASTLFARHPATLNTLSREASLRLRSSLFKNHEVRRDDFAAVALLLGHGSPAMSMEHYIHCLDWCRALGKW